MEIHAAHVPVNVRFAVAEPSAPCDIVDPGCAKREDDPMRIDAMLIQF